MYEYSKLDSLREIINSRMDELIEEISTLKKENQRLRGGFQGSCYCCEPVGELNAKLIERGYALYRALAYFTNFSFMHEEYRFSQEKKAVEEWKELFNNDIPKADYED